MIRLFLCSFLLFSTLGASEPNRILYLMRSGHTEKAFAQYLDTYHATGHHDFDVLSQMSLQLLAQGFRSRDPETQLMAIFGAGISMNERALPLLEEGLHSQQPLIQLAALNYLTTHQSDVSEEALNRAMRSNFFPIRLEACFHLAEMKHPKAIGLIESLMQKVPPPIHPLFCQLFAMVGNKEAMKILQRMLVHPDETMRIQAILSIAKQRRDDLLPQIRTLITHHHAAQQEACAFALGELKDETSIPKLRELAKSNAINVKLAALQALYELGDESVRKEVEAVAMQGNPFAFTVLGQMVGSENTLLAGVRSPNIHLRINAGLSLLELDDARAISVLSDILIKDSRDLVCVKATTQGQALHAWKVIPSARQNLSEEPVAFEVALKMRESVLAKAVELSEKNFLKLAHLIFDSGQNDLVPLLVQLLENIQTPEAIALLKKHREKIGSPLIRNYCNLALFRLKEPGPYGDALKSWIAHRQDNNLIQFRPFVPWEMRDPITSQYQLTPHDASKLLVESFEAFARTQDDSGIAVLIDAIRYGNPKNKYALAGLLMRTAQ